MTLSAVRIVLVETSHPGNIGAAARAMKNMGLSDLRLVRPGEFPSIEANARASGAEDVVKSARVYETFEEAIADCGLVVGTSARSRHVPFSALEPRECAAQVVAAARDNRVALVFGSERVGLSNADLSRCHCLITIPTSETYSSLNLAMAVQVLAYEIFLAARGHVHTAASREAPFATVIEMNRFYEHLEQVLRDTDFRDHSGNGQLMVRVRRLFNRAQPDQNEIRILRGILSAVQAKRRGLST
jgi:TrmH family RNA methyltransferase